MGFVLGIGLAVGLLVLIRSTRYGFEMRVVGDSPQAANYSGIRTKRKILSVMAISGGIAGIAGSSQIGDFGHVLDPRGLEQAQYGYTGIVVAALALYNPLAVVIVSLLYRRPHQRRLRPRRAFVPDRARRHHGGDHPFHRSRRRDSRPLQDRATPPGRFPDARSGSQRDRGGVMNSNIVLAVVVSAIAFGTPLVLAGLGELLAERSGVLNLGVEGMMLMGAVTAFFVSQKTHGPTGLVLLLAVLASMVAGAAMALIHAFLTITIRVNQIVSGLAITIFAGIIGLSSYLGQVWNIGGVAGHHQFNGIDLFGLQEPADRRADHLQPGRLRLCLLGTGPRRPRTTCTGRGPGSTCGPWARTRPPRTPWGST